MNLTNEDLQNLILIVDKQENDSIIDYEVCEKLASKLRKMINRKKNELPIYLNIHQVETTRVLFNEMNEARKENKSLESIVKDLEENEQYTILMLRKINELARIFCMTNLQ